MRRGVYPGSFNPPTIGHEAVAAAARQAHDLDLVVVTLSHRALAKEHVEHPRFADRLAVVQAWAEEHSWLEVEVTELQLLADIAAGFDVLIMGADKYHQIQDPSWYGGIDERDAAMSSLPTLAVAPRHPLPVPPELALDLDGAAMGAISSSAVRAGHHDLMVPAAQQFAQRSGAWIDPERYDRSRLTRPD